MELQLFDFGIVEGHRDQNQQDIYYMSDRSKVKWPNSKHNQMPSKAFDFVLWLNGQPEVGDENKPSYYMAVGVFKAEAKRLGIDIRAGADWDGDFSTTDQSFHDLMHIELLED